MSTRRISIRQYRDISPVPSDDRSTREAAERGSRALAVALWRYGVRHGGLPNMSRQDCELRLAGRVRA